MKPEELAERILHAAGSGLRHYMPSSKERILEEANKIMASITHPEAPQKPVDRPEPARLCLPQELTNKRIEAIATLAGIEVKSEYGKHPIAQAVCDAQTLVAFSRLLLSEVYK